MNEPSSFPDDGLGCARGIYVAFLIEGLAVCVALLGIYIGPHLVSLL